MSDAKVIREFIGRLDKVEEDVPGKYGLQIEFRFYGVEVTRADGDVVLPDFRLISWVKQSKRKNSVYGRMLVDWEAFAKAHSIEGLPDGFYGTLMRWEERTYELDGNGSVFVPVEVIRESATLPEDFAIQTGQYPHTDLGNAQRLVKRHGRDSRYCHHWKTWLVWDGRRWTIDDTGAVMRRAKETVRAMYLEASALLALAAQELDEESGKQVADRANHLSSWARRSENVHRIDAMIKLAQSEPGIPVPSNQLDADPWLLNCETGTIDLRTGQLREHRREDLITKLAPVKFAPNAACPTFDRFLAHIMAEDDELIGFLQLAIGYSLTGDVSEQVLIILFGSGANGKSTFLNAVMGMLGDYAMKASPDLLMKTDSHPTEKTDLFGKRFVAAIETEEGRKLAEVFVKEATGGDPIRARRMRENFWQFNPTHKLFLATNYKPDIKDNGQAMWRRLRLVPFNVTIPDNAMDKDLPEKLRAEWPGIMAWAVRGCLKWQEEGGLGFPDKVKTATEDYRQEMDVLADFFEERCDLGRDKQVPSVNLYWAYTAWCHEGGSVPLARNIFGERLRARGFTDARPSTDGKQIRVWKGLALKEQTDKTE